MKHTFNTLVLILTVISLITIGYTETKNEEKRKSNLDRDRKNIEKPQRGPDSHNKFQFLMHRLKLDEAQKSLVKDLMQEAQENRRAISKEIEDAHEKMTTLVEDDSTDENTLIEQGRSLGELKVKEKLVMRNFFFQLKPHLNSEQIEILEQMKAKRQEMKKQGEKRRFRLGGERGPEKRKGERRNEENDSI